MTWSDRTPSRLLAATLALGSALGAMGALSGCRRAVPAGFLLRPLVEARRFEVGRRPRDEGSSLAFARRPELADLEEDYERRPVVLTNSSPWRWRGRVPPGGRLHTGLGTLPAVWRSIRGIEATVVVRTGLGGREREVLAVARTREHDHPRWLDFDADLSRYGGQEVTIELKAELVGLPPGYRGANLVAWGPVGVSAFAAGAPHPRPNVLFILVDTLRRDRLTPYGYGRDTSPEIARRLAAPGTVVEEAYSQAPWTLPSVVSFMTGRYPGELLGADLASYGVPAGIEVMSERLGKLGYETGAFLANPALHAGAGFERGFRTFYAPPADVEWIRKHADSLNVHALPWLAGHRDRPFFLYVHYVDPHDPYENPEIVNGRSPFLPGYQGPVTGEWVHGIYTGRRQLPDPARDLPQINALYDSEVHYVDRYIGQLLAALPREVLRDTLVVLTADHGEEIDDHGGWKHGQTLYDEQIHVPLIFRWDGHVRAGKRLAGTVRLLDLLPTISAAAGGRPDPAWQGIDLLPALTAEGAGASLPERPAFSHGLAGGPLRAAAVLGREKLILFNREEPFQPADDLQAYLWRKDLGRMERVELYDLGSDPGEHRNLAAQRPEDVARLEPLIYRQLDRELPGLKVLAAGFPAGVRLSGSIDFECPPERWSPYFLAPGDRVEIAGGEVRFDLAAERLAKGFRLEGVPSRILRLEVRQDGRPLAGGQVRIGGGAPYGGGAVQPRELLARGWPALPQGPALALWRHDASGAAARRGHDAETERRLRALGYIQ
ncbi:MAG TPA: sulfatase [Thermoanaerobaculia bacterium]|nr:sulfatase [Thermoanaerobaculia bacterium]